jgi:type II secretory pathway pseudopilin PulG
VRRLREEEGWTVVSAMLVGIVVLGLGLAVMATVDVQSRQSGVERAKEGAFQLAESALNNTTLQLTRTWPTSTSTAYPLCTQASSPSSTCIGSSLAPNFTGTSGTAPRGGTDFNSTPTFTTRILDDMGGPSYYSESLVGTAPAYDANADGYVWVRSNSAVAGHTSVLVQLVGQGQVRQETLPKNAITAGFFKTTNTGKKVIVDAKGTSAVAGNIAARCATSAPSAANSCLGYDPTKGQLSPASAWKASYVDGNTTPTASNRSALGSAALARLKQRAITLGTYYAAGSCPSSLTGPVLPDGTRALIYVENANCSYSGGTFNSAALPGVVIFGAGTLTLGGSATYNGLIYMANGQGTAPSSGPCTSSYQNTVVTTTGTALIKGSIYIDKCGGYLAGASGLNFVYDANAANFVVSNGVVQAVKNSFRFISSS